MIKTLVLGVKRFVWSPSGVISNVRHNTRNYFNDVRPKPSKGNMVRILNVAEKNDAAKSLAEIMSRGHYRKREGFSRFNKIYEFEYNILNYTNATMTMTSLSGHLLNYDFVGQYKKWYSCSPVALFDAPVEKCCPKDYVDIKRTLEREIRGCQNLIIWTDCDREGENIGYEVINVCQAVKPSIRVYRARFSEITPQAVTRALNNLQPPDKNTSDAVDVRQELDLRIGASFTRFQTLRLQKVFPDVLADSLISYGSCQFPTLGFVVERYKQVQAFIPEPFWKIRVSHDTDEGNVEFNWKRQRLFDHTMCLVLYQHCLEKPEAKVEDIKSKPKNKWRPAALDTVELEKLASRKLRINAKETMKIAEKLYTQGFISYPRTETNIFPQDFDLARLIELQAADQNWGEFAGRVLQQGPNPRNGNKSDKAHPPIHPTKYTNSLQGNEKRIYEFVVRHFLACCSADAKGQETTVEISINEERFTAQGLMIFERNYLDVYPYDKWNAKIIPAFRIGEVFQPKCIEMNQGETSPPSLLTEADLIALMDKHGIGTDATHAEHIETIKSRLYVGVRDDGRFVPGELGMGLVEGYDAMGFEMSKPHLRSELEADLKLICDGRKQSGVVLEEQIRKYKQVFIEACNQALKIDQALSEYFGAANSAAVPEHSTTVELPVKSCPRCGQNMILKTKKDGRGFFISCMGYPDCRNAVWFPDFVLEAKVLEETCSICQPGPVRKVKFKFKKGSVPPYIPLEYEGCVGGCDNNLIEVLNLRSFSGRSAAPQAGQANASSRTRNVPNNHSIHDSGYSSGNNSNGSTMSNMSSFRSQSQLTPTTRLPLSQRNGPNFLSNTGPRPSTPRASGPRASGPRANGPRANRPHPQGPPADEEENKVVCNCGKDARLLTVRKEGPNTGRQFYGCSQEARCGFFLWADEGSDENNTRSQRPTTTARSQYSNTQVNQEGPSCQCGPAKLLTVQKEGPNTGRQFYACPKARDQGCGFFKWADEIEGGTGSGYGGTSGGKRRRQSEEPGGEKRRRKCGICAQEGHNRRGCPNNK